jgi:site-specific recombinase XerD
MTRMTRMTWQPRPARPQPRHRTRPTNCGRTFPAEVLTDDEVRRLMAACKGPAFTVARHRALIALLYRGGLRVSEALRLCPKDIDMDTGAVRVLWGKGGRARTVGVDPGGLALVATWAAVRARAGVSERAPLFCTREGAAMTSGYVRRFMPRLARRAGILKRVHAHGLRHTHAAQLRAEGVDIGVIRRQLGHTSIVTTVRYLDHLAPTAVIEAIAKRAW